MKRTVLALTMAMVLGGGMLGCTTAPPSEEGKDKLSTRADSALATMKRLDPSVDRLLSSAYGYAIFPTAGKGGAIVGGAFGRGEVYEQGRFIGYAKIEQATVGAQIGGQEFSELIVFENAAALNKFKNNEYTAAANATAVILKEGVGVATQFKDGVATFVHPKAGAMAEAAVGGQKFTFQAAAERDD